VVLSRRDNYLDAEDAALRRWLRNKSHDDDDAAVTDNDLAAVKVRGLLPLRRLGVIT